MYEKNQYKNERNLLTIIDRQTGVDTPPLRGFEKIKDVYLNANKRK